MIDRQKLLEGLKDFQTRSLEINLKAIAGIVPNLQKNWHKSGGAAKQPSANFFYRQAKPFADFARRNIIERFLFYTAMAYLTNWRNGEIIIRFVESFFAFLRTFRPDLTAVEQLDYWQISVTESNLARTRDVAFATGDKQTARETQIEILAVAQQMPGCLKKAAGKQKKRRKNAKPTINQSIKRRTNSNQPLQTGAGNRKSVA